MTSYLVFNVPEKVESMSKDILPSYGYSLPANEDCFMWKCVKMAVFLLQKRVKSYS